MPAIPRSIIPTTWSAAGSSRLALAPRIGDQFADPAERTRRRLEHDILRLAERHVDGVPFGLRLDRHLPLPVHAEASASARFSITRRCRRFQMTTVPVSARRSCQDRLAAEDEVGTRRLVTAKAKAAGSERRPSGPDLGQWGAEGRNHQSNAHLAGVVSPDPVPALTLRRAGTESGPGTCVLELWRAA